MQRLRNIFTTMKKNNIDARKAKSKSDKPKEAKADKVKEAKPKRKSPVAKVLGKVGKGKKTDSKPIWWEKTIEYLFALGYMHEYEMICPLDGSHERAGDILAKAKAKWCLVEFKRYGPTKAQKKAGKTGTGSEDRKFLGPAEAQSALDAYRSSRDITFHNIAFGALKGKSLTLGAHDYWDSSQGHAVDDLLSLGTGSYETFRDYVNLFMKAKGGSSGTGGSSGGDGGSPGGGDSPDPSDSSDSDSAPELKDETIDFTNVIAVTRKSGLFCCPLKEFFETINSNSGNPPPPDGDSGGVTENPRNPIDFGGGGQALAIEIVEALGKIRPQQPEKVRDKEIAEAAL